MIRDSIESLNSEGDDESQLGAKMDANSLKNGNGSAESLGHRGNKGHEEMEMEESKKRSVLPVLIASIKTCWDSRFSCFFFMAVSTKS